MTDPNDDDIRPTMSKALEVLSTLIDHVANEYERKLFYEALDLIPWLAPKVRYAINEEVDSSTDEVVIELSPEGLTTVVDRRRYTTRAKKEEQQQIQAMCHYWSIEHRKAEMKKNGERPRGGADEAAYAEEARTAGKTVDALRQLIKRHAPKGERRAALKESAQQHAQKPEN
jgi:hypothetical protein